MPYGKFSRETHILHKGQEYIVVDRLRNRDIRIKNVATGECLSVNENDLIHDWLEGDLEFLTVRGNGISTNRRSQDFVVEELSLLDDSDPMQKKKKERLKRETLRKHRYVSEVLAQGLRKLTPQSLRPVIDKVKAEMNDPSPPSWQSLRLWAKDFVSSGEDVRVLVPRHSKKGNGKAKFGYRSTGVISPEGKRIFTDAAEEKAEEVKDIVQEAIKDVYLNENRLPGQDVIDEVEARIAANNRYRKPDDQLPEPDPTNIYRAISKLDKYEVDRARFGQRYADDRHRKVGTGPRPKRPLELVQMDSTTLDLFVVDPETGMPIGRPTFFGSICVCTKMMTGYHLSFNDTGYLAVMQCLLHAIKPKTYVKERYPNIKNEWNCYGLMEVLKVDNAMAFHGESLEDAALQLGFLIDYAPIATPWYKATIERYIGTKSRQMHRLPGTTFSNIFQRKGYDPLKHALISVNTLHEILHVFAIDIYPQRLHRGINDVPARLWNELIEKYPPALPPNVADLKVLLGHVEWRTIQRTGIEIDGLYYRSDDLSALRSRMMNKNGKAEKKVKIKKNPEDLSMIHVQDEFNGRYIPVPAEDQEYTKGLTQFQHDVIRNFARERAKNYVKREDLISAKKYIKQLVLDEWNNGKRKARGLRSARFLNHGSSSGKEANGDKPRRHVSAGSEGQAGRQARPVGTAVSGRGASDLGNALDTPSGNNGHGGGLHKDNQVPLTTAGKERQSKPSKAAQKSSHQPDGKGVTSTADNNPQATEEDYRKLPGWGVEYD
jgi:putative transposase